MIKTEERVIDPGRGWGIYNPQFARLASEREDSDEQDDDDLHHHPLYVHRPSLVRHLDPYRKSPSSYDDETVWTTRWLLMKTFIQIFNRFPSLHPTLSISLIIGERRMGSLCRMEQVREGVFIP